MELPGGICNLSYPQKLWVLEPHFLRFTRIFIRDTDSGVIFFFGDDGGRGSSFSIS